MMVDKAAFRETLRDLAIPHPHSVLLHSLDQMAELPESEYEGMFLKPVNSQEFALHHRVKAFRLDGKQHAINLMTEAHRAGRCGFPILLQEYVAGPTTNYYLVDGFVDRNGRIQALMARRRIRMYPPMFGNSSLSQTIAVDEIREAADSLERLLAACKYRGIFDAEFKYDAREGRFKLLEVNARPWWFVEFATRCGVDLCGMAYRDAQELPVEPSFQYPLGRQCIYMLGDFSGYLMTAPGVKGILKWLGSLKEAEDILFQWDDPGPGIASTFSAFKTLLKRGPISSAPATPAAACSAEAPARRWRDAERWSNPAPMAGGTPAIPSGRGPNSAPGA